MTDFVLCEICGWNLPEESEKDSHVKHGEDTNEPGELTDRLGRVYNKAEATVVYILGYNKLNEKQLDMYSGLTGYHVRTVPARRWSNPVMLGAGAGYLGIVDRFANCDVIRITNEFCGLGLNDFDSNGSVKNNVALEQVEDLARVTTPAGSHVAGLTILPRGILIANIVDAENKPKFIKVDVESLITGITQVGFNGIETLSEPFDAFGSLKGKPGRFNMAINEGMFYFVGLIEGGIGKRGITITNFINGEVHGFVGLPDDYTPITVAHGNGNIHVLVTDGTTSKVLRLPFVRGNYMFTSGSEGTDYVLEPQNLPVTHTYQTRDDINGADTADAIEGARLINSGNDDKVIGTEVPSGSVETRLIESTTMQDLAPRSQKVEDHEQSTYSDNRVLPVQVVDIPNDINLYDIEGFGNALVECSFETADGALDPTKPLFRVFHGSHYDYLSDGGWKYGCVSEGTTLLATNGLTPIAMAVDNLIYSGRLKNSPDLSPILIDYLTGKIMYRYPKVTGYQTYAGSFASMKVTENNKLKRSVCSDRADEIATALDGIQRPGVKKPVRGPIVNDDVLPVEEFNNTLELDEPCELYTRRIVPGADFGEVQLIHSSWSQRESALSSLNPALLPEWRTGQINPIVVSKSSEDGETFWPGGNPTGPKFIASATGGFWFLDLLKQQTRLADEMRQDIQELIDQNQDNENQIAAINNNLANMDESSYEDNPIQFKTPRNILKKVFKVEPRMAQEIDPITGTTNIKSIVPSPGTLWDVCPVTFESTEGTLEAKNCGIVVDPGIRSWIGIDIKCNYWGYFVNGADVYTNEEARENGLGINIGSNDALHHYDPANNPYNKFPGHTYEAGYRCSNWGDGAWGAWEVTIFVNGEPINKICTQATFLEQIENLAPEEIRDALFYDMTFPNVVPDNGFHKGKVYFTDKVVEEVTINVKLINYAASVFRYGFSTVQIEHAWRIECPGRDPGYWAGNDCIAIACGNVTCGSTMFGNDHKLKSDDPTIPLTKQLIWEGEATYRFDQDPFEERGLAAGRFMDCYFDFDLMSTIPSYRVDISESTYGGAATE